jgi:hypothetical protein
MSAPKQIGPALRSGESAGTANGGARTVMVHALEMNGRRPFNRATA